MWYPYPLGTYWIDRSTYGAPSAPPETEGRMHCLIRLSKIASQLSIFLTSVLLPHFVFLPIVVLSFKPTFSKFATTKFIIASFQMPKVTLTCGFDLFFVMPDGMMLHVIHAMPLTFRSVVTSTNRTYTPV
jgi:hypothetical protein